MIGITPPTQELLLLLPARQAMQHRTATFGRQGIVVERGPRLAEPAQPRLPLRTELRFQLFTEALGQRSAMASRGDRNLQRTAPHYGGIIEIAKGTIANHIAKDATQLRLLKHRPIHRPLRSGHENEKHAIQVAHLETPRFPDDLAFGRPSSNRPRGCGSHHEHMSSASQQSRYLLFRCLSRSDDQATALRKLNEHRKKRNCIARESRRRLAHTPPHPPGQPL